jgi:ribosomal protein L37E
MMCCPSCGRLFASPNEGCDICGIEKTTIRAPEHDLEDLLDGSRPTPVEVIEYKAVTRPAPDNGGTIVDTTEEEVDASDITCPDCGTDYEGFGNFCASCGRPRGKRHTTLPYYQQVSKPQGISAPLIPRIDPEDEAKIPIRHRSSGSYSHVGTRATIEATHPTPRVRPPKRLLLTRPSGKDDK